MEGNTTGHIEARQYASVDIVDSELSNSEKGTGLLISDSAEIRAKRTYIHHEKKTAAIVSERGNFHAKECKFTDCGICGVVTMPLSEFCIKKCEVSNNQSGACIKGGTGQISDCVFSNNKRNGIDVDTEANCEISNIRYSNNGKDLLQR